MTKPNILLSQMLAGSSVLSYRDDLLKRYSRREGYEEGPWRRFSDRDQTKEILYLADRVCPSIVLAVSLIQDVVTCYIFANFDHEGDIYIFEESYFQEDIISENLIVRPLESVRSSFTDRLAF